MKRRSGMVGTARFASIATHSNVEQGRKDDLESLGYSMVYLATGKLPWMSLETIETDERVEEIKDLKQKIDLNTLCEGLPLEFIVYFEYIKGLNFSESPSYGHIRKIISKMFSENNYTFDYVYDWAKENDGKYSLPYEFEHIKPDLIYEKTTEDDLNSPNSRWYRTNLNNTIGKETIRRNTISLCTPKAVMLKLSSRRVSYYSTTKIFDKKMLSISNSKSINETNKSKGTAALMPSEHSGDVFKRKVSSHSNVSKEIGPLITLINKKYTMSKLSFTGLHSPQLKHIPQSSQVKDGQVAIDPSECWSIDENNDIDHKMQTLLSYKSGTDLNSDVQRAVKPTPFHKFKR